MWVHLTRRRRTWLVLGLPVAGWLVARLVRSGQAPVSLPSAAASLRRRTGSTPRPAPGTGHRPASSPHARDIAAHNKRVIDDYRGRHAAPGSVS